jgi:hypothetical protein
MSFVLPLANVVAQWCGGKAPPMAALLAVQPAGSLVLLMLSVVHHVRARPILPQTTAIVRGGSAAGPSG